MEIVKADASMSGSLAELIALFRVTLDSFRGIESEPSVASAMEELDYFAEMGYPVFAAKDGRTVAGYVVCRTEGPCLWVEQLYVRDEYRRRGVGTLLFKKAEELASSMGEDTVYNYVHPNNDRVIGFLRSLGYTVLNLIEVRKPYRGETLKTKIPVGNNEFDY